MKITVLEHVPFSEAQKDRLLQLGDVTYFSYDEDTSVDIILQETKDSDVVVVNWIDPSPFILSLKQPSLVALMSTGYGWIQHLEEARKKGILVSNIPAYSTEAVAEHIFGLLLSYTKRINISSNWTRPNETRMVVSSIFGREIVTPPHKPSFVGTELKGKTLGIIGLGHIGSRAAELAKAFGMNIITYNRNKKNSPQADDVSLNELLAKSDVVCITCPLNDQSKKLINSNNLGLIKKSAVLTGATWGVIDEEALLEALKNGQLNGVAFDVALEGSEKIKCDELLAHPNFLCTKHNAYNTFEAAERQRDICISNIEAFANGHTHNIVN